jgi:hypothetical protein
MFRKISGICLVMAFAISPSWAGEVDPAPANLSAAAIVEKNVTARGGLQAWRAVQTMSMEGKMGVGGNQRAALPTPSPAPGHEITKQMLPQRPADEVQLPFVMDLKRSRKMRFELQFNGQTAVQVYDGTNGWKLRPFLNRREVEPYTPDEMKKASMQADLDGPLVDYAAKGTRVDLDGVEKVENRDNYKLKLTMKDGNSVHVWIDSQTFLETKIEGQPRTLDGLVHPVEVYYRDFRPVDGLQIPFVLETKVLPISKVGQKYVSTPVPVERTVIEKVTVNPKFAESLFSKPDAAAVAASNVK